MYLVVNPDIAAQLLLNSAQILKFEYLFGEQLRSACYKLQRSLFGHTHTGVSMNFFTGVLALVLQGVFIPFSDFSRGLLEVSRVFSLHKLISVVVFQTHFHKLLLSRGIYLQEIIYQSFKISSGLSGKSSSIPLYNFLLECPFLILITKASLLE